MEKIKYNVILNIQVLFELLAKIEFIIAILLLVHVILIFVILLTGMSLICIGVIFSFYVTYLSLDYPPDILLFSGIGLLLEISTSFYLKLINKQIQKYEYIWDGLNGN